MKRLKPIIYFLMVILIIIAIALSYNRLEKTIYPLKYSGLVEKYSKEYNLDKSLVYAVIKCESSFKPEAKSSAGAIGLMQLTPETFDWLLTKTDDKKQYDINDLYIEKTNIKFGCFLLRLHLNEFDNLEIALAAYHAGRGIVNEWLSKSADGMTLNTIPYSDTRDYVQRVMSVQEKYNDLYNWG